MMAVSRVALALLGLALIGVASAASVTSASRKLASVGAARKLSSFTCNTPADCDPTTLTCNYWKNPCPTSKVFGTSRYPDRTYGTCFNSTGSLVTYVGVPPNLVCTSTLAIAVTKNDGCASVISTAFGASMSQDVFYTSKIAAQTYIKKYLSGDFSLSVAAYGFAQALSKAAAYYLVNFAQQTCYCCDKPAYTTSSATANVSAAAQAIATTAAEAFALIEADYPAWYKAVVPAPVNAVDVGSDLVTGGEGTAFAFAADFTGLAASLVGAMQGKYSLGPNGTSVTNGGTAPSYLKYAKGTTDCFKYTAKDLESACVTAFTCTAVSAFAKIVYDNNYLVASTIYNGTTSADNSSTVTLDEASQAAKLLAAGCSGSVAVAGIEGVYKCPVDCPCKWQYLEDAINDNGGYLSIEQVSTPGEGGICPVGSKCPARPDYNGTTSCQCNVAGETPCEYGCTNTKTDKYNCGYCGTKCSGSKVCINGSCASNPCTLFNPTYCPKSSPPYYVCKGWLQSC